MAELLEETEPQSARFEIYVRMNDDPEKDYCFNVGIEDTFDALLPIFKTLSLSLRPSVFYEQFPIGFKVSEDPGYLTANGGVLFTDRAGRLSRNVKLTDTISDHVWPGQLILPVWKEATFNFYSITLGLLVWLYTDLPDFISPTPGICFTNQVSRLFALLARSAGRNELAADLLSETVVNKSSTVLQCVFFAFHVVKVLIIFFTFWLGLFNPYSLNPFVTHRLEVKIDDDKKQELLKLGWTGSRKATIEEFKEYNRTYQIEKVGGIVKASKLKLFDKLREPGVKLHVGEGFQSSLDNKTTLKDLEKNPIPLIFNYEWFTEIGESFERQLQSKPSNVNKQIKEYRKYGPLDTSERIKKIIEERKARELPTAETKETTTPAEKVEKKKN